MFSRIVSLACIGSVLCGALVPLTTSAYESQFFLVSAYYSPLPGQSYYLHGDYESEVRINGNGTHGASGQGVRPGMIAAPKNYPFGAKIALEGIGVGTVLDRGGAIVEADQSGSFTRLDLYMGAGEEGLCRAMKFGMKSVYGTAFTLEESEQIDADSVDFTNFPADCSFVTGEGPTDISVIDTSSKETSLRDSVLDGGVLPTSSGSKIMELKKLFDETGYLIGGVNSEYDANLTNTIYRFQLSQGIIGSPYDDGAGYYGPKTRAALKDLIYKPAPVIEESEDTSEQNSADVTVVEEDRSQTITQGQESIFDARIVESSDEDDIRELQFVLKQLGYFEYEQDGVYNKRLVDAIYAFQLDQKIVSSSSEAGAGYYGPKTRAALKEAFQSFQGLQTQVVELKTKIAALNVQRTRLIEQKRKEFTDQIEALGLLQEGAVSSQVRELQKLLKSLGYMEAKDTAIFGLATKGGLAAYQLDLGVIDRIDSPYAGILGGVTRTAISDDLLRRFELEDRTYLDEIDSLNSQIKEIQG